ncbi:hypothetical protein MLD38_002349 [Melastoma candidum]|uniref:Uncharacterized protein n=1 Tax=Melastoma candidum TaxID=119954 RepID=A0ACB9S111_9MYRT|nr:hypothetical protein MLD38_002349 [Melastoma candidum]
MKFHRRLLSSNSSSSSSSSNTTDHPSGDTSPNSISPTIVASTSSIDSKTTTTSISSDLSIQTLPSLPSLQLDIPARSFPDFPSVAYPHLLASVPPPHPSLPITSLAISGNLLYAASSHLVRVFLLPDLTPVDSFLGNDPSAGSVKSFAFTVSGAVLTAHQDSKVRVWETTVGSSRHRLVATLPTVTDRLMNFILPRNYVDIRRHKKCLWIEHADAVTALAVHEDSIYSVSWDRSLKVWRGSNLRCMESVKAAHEDAVNALTVGPNGAVYTGSADGKIRVWTRRGGSNGGKRPRHILAATLDKHKSAINALALNEDGSVLFSGACDRSIVVWEREGGTDNMVAVGALRGHGKAILCMISVGREVVISGSADRTVRVWRGEGGKFRCMAVMEGHEKGVKSLEAVAVSGGVVSVVSGSLDGEIRLWHVDLKQLP